MKRKGLLLLVVIALVAAMFAGCGKKDKEGQEGKDLVINSNKEGPVQVTFDGYGYAWGMIVYAEAEDETAESETVSMDFEAMPGEIIQDVWEKNGYAFQRIYADGEFFEGWMEYKTNKTTDADGNDTYRYERISGNELYTTEDILSREVPAYDVAYVAKWESIPMENYDEEFEMMYAEEEVTEEDMGVETTFEGEAYLVLDANGGQMLYGTDEPYETDIYTYLIENGKTIKSIMNSDMEDPMKSVEKDGKKFAGWKVYEGVFVEWPEEKPTNLKAGEECYQLGDYMYLRLSDCSVYDESMTTEEMGKLVGKGKTYYAVANWK